MSRIFRPGGVNQAETVGATPLQNVDLPSQAGQDPWFDLQKGSIEGSETQTLTKAAPSVCRTASASEKRVTLPTVTLSGLAGQGFSSNINDLSKINEDADQGNITNTS